MGDQSDQVNYTRARVEMVSEHQWFWYLLYVNGLRVVLLSQLSSRTP